MVLEPIKDCFITLCAQFRMIFVCIAYEDVSQHTAGFLGLQISLLLIAIQHTLFIIDSNISYDFLGGKRNTRIAAVSYLVGLLAISPPKIASTIYVVLYGHGASWTLANSAVPGLVIGQTLDLIWMIFNGVLPLFIAYIRFRNESKLIFVIKSEEGEEDSGEYLHVTSSDDITRLP